MISSGSGLEIRTVGSVDGSVSGDVTISISVCDFSLSDDQAKSGTLKNFSTGFKELT